jgi:hypothetical protein
MSISHREPYARASLEDLFGPDDTPDVEDPRVDEHTLKARKYSSDFVAALKATLKAAGFSDEVLKPFMTVMDAASRADNKRSKRRHFHCADWVMALFHRRGPFPDGLPEDEERRRKASLARFWVRAWEPIHAEQCQTHIGFVLRDPGKIINNKRFTSAYEDRLTDVVSAVLQLARQIRARRVDRFDMAAAEVLEQFKRDFPAYAPEWEPPEPTMRAEVKPKEDDGDPPEIQSFRRAVLRIRKLAAALPEDEAEAMRRNSHKLFDEIWTGQPAEYIPVPPVSYDMDMKNAEWLTEAVRESELRVATSDGKTEKAAENGTYAPDHIDRSVYMNDSDEPDEMRAVEAFERAGAESFLVVLLDETKPKGSPPALVETVDGRSLRKHLPRYLKRNEDRPESLIIRPNCTKRIIHFDDCTPDQLRCLEPHCFLQELTSDGNGQAFIELSDELSDEAFDDIRKRAFAKLNPTGDRKQVNRGSSGSTRWPGSLNRKPSRIKADGTYPHVRVVMTAPGCSVSVADLERDGLLAPEEKKEAEKPPRYTNTKLPDSWPDIHEYLSRTGDRSSPEMSWCMAALRRGWPQHSVEARLKEVGPKAQTRRDGYARRTVAAAASMLARSPEWGASA